MKKFSESKIVVFIITLLCGCFNLYSDVCEVTIDGVKYSCHDGWTYAHWLDTPQWIYEYNPSDFADAIACGAKAQIKPEVTFPATDYREALTFPVYIKGCEPEVVEMIIKEGCEYIDPDFCLNNAGYGDEAIKEMNLKVLHIPASLSKADWWYQVEGGEFNEKRTELEFLNLCGFDKLENIIVSPANPVFTYKDGMLLSKDQKTLVSFLTAVKGTDCVIPEGIEKIGISCFQRQKITSVSLPLSLKIIEQYAFYNLPALKSLIIPDNVDFCGVKVAANCEALENLVIGNSVKDLYYCAFDGLKNLKNLTLGRGLVQISGQSAFEGMGITALNIPGNLKQITGIGCFSQSENLKSVNFEEGIEEIGECCFEDCMNLESVVIPNSVKKIDDFAFNNCTSLENLTIGQNVKIIGEGAFEDCNIKELSICNGIEEIGRKAFAYNNNLKILYIPQSVKKICSYAFGRKSTAQTSSIHGEVNPKPGQMEKIYCGAVIPPELENDVFNGIDHANCLLIVPEGSEGAYITAEQWKDFYIVPSTVESTVSESVRIAVEGKEISVVGGKDNELIVIYDMKGLPVYRGTDKSFVVNSSGIYIVKVDSKVCKIVVE
jgi:hypothetical protein